MQVQPNLLEKLEAYASALAPTIGPFLESLAAVASSLGNAGKPRVENADE
jgi:hypothetical protein